MLAAQLDLARDSRAFVTGFDVKRNVHFVERPAFALRVHFQRDRRTRAKTRQQQRDRRRAAIAAAERFRFVGEPRVLTVVKMDLIIRRTNVGGDGGFCHARS